MSNGTSVSAPPPLLLRPKDAAKLLAISPRKLWALTACEAIPCVRIDRAVRYDPADLRAWIATKKTGASK